MIDVSAAQGKNIDWDAVKASGIEVVVVECGLGNDGSNPVDMTQALGARGAGLRVKLYSFGYALPPDGIHEARDPVSQAKLHCTLAAAVGITEDPILDLEFPALADFAKWNVNAAYVRGWALSYLATVESVTGRVPWLYGSKAYLQAIGCEQEPALSRYPLWIADWNIEAPTAPAPWADWMAWQYAATGSVPGIVGPVDLSWLRQAPPTDPDPIG
jgi:GH25 family lysozyme M1 (1,4-beta-N-acetylmuramidase)